jgi:hypothetical protein
LCPSPPQRESNACGPGLATAAIALRLTIAPSSPHVASHDANMVHDDLLVRIE